MATVKRYERHQLRFDAKNRTPQGFLRCDATIARTGVQAYRQPDGTVRMEYRPADEVFHGDALASFSLAPLTLEHPPEPITAANAQKYAVGTVGEMVKQDGKFVATTVLVTDARAIEAAETGKAAELSCGYECDLEATSGTTPDGQRYDAVQRNIRGNHVALVPKGRAGADVRLRMDAQDAEQVDLPAHNDGGRTTMKKIKIDGVEYEVTEQVAQAFERAQAKQDTEAATLKAQLTAVKADAEKDKARADQAEAARTKAEKERADAVDPKALDARVNARVVLVSTARKHLGAEAKTDGVDDVELKRAVLVKLSPDLKLDGKTPGYIEAAFDYAIEAADKRSPAEKARGAGVGDPNRGDQSDAEPDEAAAREKMRKDHADAWKQPLNGAPVSADKQ
jgi:hypothetical protein